LVIGPRPVTLGGGKGNENNVNWTANCIWGIADEVLRDVFVRGRYRDVILPMSVVRRFDAILERTRKVSVRSTHFPRFESGVTLPST